MGQNESAYATLVKNVKGGYHLERRRHRWDANNIKMRLTGMGY